MPSIGFGEVLVILLIALLIFGPKRLPGMGRSLGRAVREFRRSTAEFRADFESDLEEEERPTVPEPRPPVTPAQGDGKGDSAPA